MPIKKILAPLSLRADSAGLNETAVESALAMGQRFDAHVEVLAISADPRDSVAFVGEGMTGAMIEEIMVAAEKESGERMTDARHVFDGVCRRVQPPRRDAPAIAGFSAALVERVGRIDDWLPARGRMADLIVIVREPGEDEGQPRIALEIALRETGRPVLVVPGRVAEAPGKHIAIAWNGSIESSRAVALAAPFVQAAEKVTVLSVTEGDTGCIGSGDMGDYLAWHGIDADTKVLDAAARSAGSVILDELAAVGADMLVMGAYSRSRMRRLIFGGVTGEVIARAEVPVLMVH